MTEDLYKDIYNKALDIISRREHSSKEVIEKLARKFTSEDLINSTIENIGARRLHTILERVLEDISFSAPDKGGQELIIDSEYVNSHVDELSKNTDLSKFIL